MASNLIQVIAALGAVIGLFLVMAWVMRRFAQGPGMAGGHMKILSAMSVGTREKILVVDVEGQQLLLGVTGQQISTLHTFSEPAITVKEKHTVSDFSQKLQSILTRNTFDENNAPSTKLASDNPDVDAR